MKQFMDDLLSDAIKKQFFAKVVMMMMPANPNDC
jgi:hypothetical protein